MSEEQDSPTMQRLREQATAERLERWRRPQSGYFDAHPPRPVQPPDADPAE